MAQTITLSKSEFEKLVDRVQKLEKQVKKLLSQRKLVEGSDEWWEKEIAEGKKDIEEGRYTEFQSIKDLQTHLKSLE